MEVALNVFIFGRFLGNVVTDICFVWFRIVIDFQVHQYLDLIVELFSSSQMDFAPLNGYLIL